MLSLESIHTKAIDDLDDFKNAVDELVKAKGASSNMSHMENRYPAETDFDLDSVT